MPFYEYKAKDVDKSCEQCYNILEILQKMSDKPLKKCPHCHSPVDRLISVPAAVIIEGKEMNQYNDVKLAKYWRDKNGVRHKVTQADGNSKSPTVTQQTVTPEVAEARRKRDMAIHKQKLAKRGIPKR